MSSQFKQAENWVHNNELPEAIVNSGIYYFHNQIDMNFLCKYVSKYENNRFAEKAPDGSIPPQPLGNFFSLNANLGWSTGSIYRIRYYIEITNLTNVRYSTVVGYPDYGRRFRLGISLRV